MIRDNEAATELFRYHVPSIKHSIIRVPVEGGLIEEFASRGYPTAFAIAYRYQGWLDGLMIDFYAGVDESQRGMVLISPEKAVVAACRKVGGCQCRVDSSTRELVLFITRKVERKRSNKSKRKAA